MGFNPMNDAALGQFIQQTFMQHVPMIAGAVIVLTTALFFTVVIRSLLKGNA
jgi:hypothetical protein